MSGPSNTGSGAGARMRRGGLALVMVGALSVSVRGQVEAVAPLLGGMSVVLALTNDLAALLALNELMSTHRRDVRRWAWAVLVLAGGTAAGLNTWHSVQAGALPPVWAVVVGIGPVLLAVVLSHLVALVLNDAPAEPAPTVLATTSTAPPTAAAAVPALSRPAVAAENVVSVPAVESSRAAQASTAALSGPGVHHGLAVVPAPHPRPAHAPPVSGRPVAARPEQGTDPRVDRLAAQLRAGEVGLTGAAAAEQLGCSERTGRRLLRQAEDQVAATTSARERGTG